MIVYIMSKVFIQGMIKVKKDIIKKDITAECSVCRFGRALPDGSGILCEKCGVRRPDSSCKKFKYDPLKRVPRRMPAMMEFSKEDFEL